jgi:hypothetical protein
MVLDEAAAEGTDRHLSSTILSQLLPLEVRDLITIQREDLRAGQGLKIPNMFQIHLDDFEGFGRVPVDEVSFFQGASRGLLFGQKAVFIASEDIADGRPGT